MASALFLCGCSEKNNSKQEQTDSAAAQMSQAAKADSAFSIPAPQGNPLENAPGRIKNGMIIAGEGSKIRAFSPFHSGEGVSRAYIKLINEFRDIFPDVNLYAAVIPGQAAYYVPKMVADKSNPMKPAFDYLKANLHPSIKYIDVYNILAGHTKEPIYSRTDHHWAPLGAYYVAEALANAAGVPFKDLSNYDKHVVHGYVGSMFHYTGEQAIKDNPEDFYYYTPKGTNEKTTFIPYNKNKETGAISEGKPYQGQFFRHYDDGAGGAYCAFMGGDHFIVKVETGVANGRRLLIIKDSHGNPIPAYLFHSFEEIHVIDYRYFLKNLKEYVADNKISDILLAFGINTSSGSGNMQKVRDFITQTPVKQSQGTTSSDNAEEPRNSKKRAAKKK